MSVETKDATLESVLVQLSTLTLEQLLTIQEAVGKQLRQKLGLNAHSSSTVTSKLDKYILPKPTPEQTEAELREAFGDEYDEIMATDLNSIPPSSKTVAEIIREDRDRY